MSQPSWIGYTLGGRYKIDALLGQGGMSAVYRATDPNLRRTVAVKMIHSHLSGDPDFVRRFEAEAAAVAQLRHPNIIQVYDFNHDGDTYYMVLEYVPGETLHARLRRLSTAQQRMPLDEALNILASIADAVDYAHQRGLIHRDIKPANIMINPQGQAVLMDFGVAKILGGAQHTATGAVVGTALYISPEQVMGQRPTERSDIYSLGVTLFEMVAGRPPFEGDSAMSVMLKHVNEPVPDIRELQPATPPEVVAVVERALAKDPAQRYQSAADLAAALRDVLGRMRAGGATVIEPAPLPPRTEAATIIEPPSRVSPATSAGSYPPGQPPSATWQQTGAAVPPPPVVAPPTGTGATLPPPAQPAPAAPPRRSFPVWLLVGVPLVALCLLAGTVGGLFGLFNMLSGRNGAATATATEPGVTQVAAATDTQGAVVDATATQAPSPEPTATATAEPTPTEIPVPEGMVMVPGGTFNMGSEQGAQDERPVHPVTLDAFFIHTHEVTNADYQACVDAGACTPPALTGSFNRFSYFNNPEFANFPVVAVTHAQAQTYCGFVGGRLPTEAEWEYAATGGDGRRYPWGNEFDRNRVPSSAPDTVAVGTFLDNASPFGVFDMAGNVLEWVADFYDSLYYAESPEENPTGPESGTQRVARGGSFGAADGGLYTTTRRFRLNPNATEVDVGFRCVVPAPAP